MSKDENLFKELPENLRKKFLDLFKVFGDVNEFEKIKGKSIIDWMAFIIKSSLEFLQDKQKLKEFLQIVPDLIVNYDKLIINSDIVDKEHYLVIHNNLISGLQINKDQTIEISNSYLSSVLTKFPLQNITYSILLFRDFVPDLYKLMETAPIEEYSEKFAGVLYDMIEKNQMDQFQLYFFDWVLKFGYLIEAYVKEFLNARLKLRCILNKEDYSKIANKNQTIGQILRTLKTDNSLAFIRNAIFHTNFILDYHIDYDKRKIIFRNWEGKIKNIGINNFVESYFKLFQFVQTEILAFSFFTIKINEKPLKLELQKQTDALMNYFENIDAPEFLLNEENLDKFTEKLKKILKIGLGLENHT